MVKKAQEVLEHKEDTGTLGEGENLKEVEENVQGPLKVGRRTTGSVRGG